MLAIHWQSPDATNLAALHQIPPAEVFSQWPVNLQFCLLKATSTWRWSTELFYYLLEVKWAQEKTKS